MNEPEDCFAHITRLESDVKHIRELMRVSESSIEKRFDNTNEWRATYEDLAHRKLSRDEYFTAHNALVEKIDVMLERIKFIEGKGVGISSTVATLISVGGLILAIAAMFAVRVLH